MRMARFGALERHLASQSWFANETSEPATWHLVSSVSASGVRYGNAHILSLILNLHDDKGELVLLGWSRQYPDLAKVFWPEVVQAALEENYELLPEMFKVAQKNTDPAQLARELSVK
jgi:hypothetical protein